MVAATYSNILNTVQTQVRLILQAATTVSSLANTKILDGSATNLTRQYSTFVLCHTPTVRESSITIGRYKRVTINMDIEVFSTKESVCRQLVDAIRAGLEADAGLDSLNAAGLRNKKVESTTIGSFDFPTGETIDTRHVMSINLLLEWTG